MDGRIRSGVLAGLAATALTSIGCRYLERNEPTLPNATIPIAGVNPPAKPGFFSSAPKYGPPVEQIPIRDAALKNKPFKADTFVAVGDAELEAAFDENRNGADRDQLIDVARQRYTTALQQDAKNKDALLGLGRLYTWAGDRDRALQMYQDASKYHPKNKDVAFAIVRCYVRFQDWNAACQACDAALAIDPENRHYTKTLGYCQARSDRWDDAFGTLMKIMSESEARTFLGQTLIALGRNDDGFGQLRMAVTTDPQNATAQSILASLQQNNQPSSLQQTAFEGAR